VRQSSELSVLKRKIEDQDKVIQALKEAQERLSAAGHLMPVNSPEVAGQPPF